MKTIWEKPYRETRLRGGGACCMLRTNILEGRMPYNKNKPDFWDKTPETFAKTPEYPDGVYLRANGRPDPRKGRLTNRQETFADLVAEGIYTYADCARKAGYSQVVAAQYGKKLMNGVDFPNVVERVAELREERKRRYGVTLIGQLERLSKLSQGAEKANQYSAAINAEKIRSAMGGLTIDRRETINTLDQLSRDEITAKLAELHSKYPQAFQFDDRKLKDVTPDEPRPRSEILELSASKQANKRTVDED